MAASSHNRCRRRTAARLPCKSLQLLIGHALLIMLPDLTSATIYLAEGEAEHLRGIISPSHSDVGMSGLASMSCVQGALRMAGAAQLSGCEGQRMTLSWVGRVGILWRSG